jgi:uncharacterized protein YdhG (YjbR/CyaY superfamily)
VHKYCAMETVQIKDHSNLVRDIYSKAILNTDSNNALQRYRQQTKIFENAKQQINEIEEMKNDIREIKECIKFIIEKFKEN